MTDSVFLKRLDRIEMLYEVSSSVTEATNKGLKVLVGLIEKCSCLYEVSSY